MNEYSAKSDNKSLPDFDGNAIEDILNNFDDKDPIRDEHPVPTAVLESNDFASLISEKDKEIDDLRTRVQELEKANQTQKVEIDLLREQAKRLEDTESVYRSLFLINNIELSVDEKLKIIDHINNKDYIKKYYFDSGGLLFDPRNAPTQNLINAGQTALMMEDKKSSEGLAFICVL
eukprot:TRINITY_DN3457_c0_g2_i1.p1 TRINITY_DN3457_c0_g2~~TRINITY_DN3457_c0_g2_i1.p1  ORF type:complete len:176 (+),score=55.46 TRINITY_DN3457_c0_g2_i1:138-665(+)